MPFQLSPGVIFTETDLTLIVPTVATTGGGMVGAFTWGPAREITLIESEKELVEKFGSPAYDAEYARYWFTASNFLKYGNNLQIVREIDTDTDKTATCVSGISTIYNEDTYLDQYAIETANGPFCAKYSGEAGNSLKVYILDHIGITSPTDSVASDDYYDLIDNFDGIPGTSPWAETLTGDTDINDELHILVVDEDGAFSGVAGTVLEKFSYLSKARNAKTQEGTSNYYKDIINNRSDYIRWLSHPTAYLTGSGAAWGTDLLLNGGAFKVLNDGDVGPSNSAVYGWSLTGGVTSGVTSGTTVAEADIAAAYSTYFELSEDVDVSLLVAGPLSATNANLVIEVAEARKDCVAFVSPKPTSGDYSVFDLQDAIDYRNLLDSSSYGVMDSGYKLQYDNYNDRYIYVPLCADVAGCCVRTDLNQDPWYSPAGFNRGQIRNVVRLPYNPGKTDRDELYKKSINPIVSFEGEGTVLYGDKTLLARPSAFDRINVRRLFIVLEKAIAKASKYLLFEFNDQFTRAQFKQLVEPYLREVQGRRGIQDFRVVCDETNNTPQVIDSNGFVGDIYIKPNRSINFIQLNFIATPTGVSFDEIGA